MCPITWKSWSRMASFLLEITQPDCDVSTWTATVRVVAYHVEKRVVAPECRVWMQARLQTEIKSCMLRRTKSSTPNVHGNKPLSKTEPCRRGFLCVVALHGGGRPFELVPGPIACRKRDFKVEGIRVIVCELTECVCNTRELDYRTSWDTMSRESRR